MFDRIARMFTSDDREPLSTRSPLLPAQPAHPLLEPAGDGLNTEGSWSELTGRHGAAVADRESERDATIAQAQAVFDRARTEAQQACSSRTGELDAQLESERAKRHEALRADLERELTDRFRAFVTADYPSDARKFCLEFAEAWRQLCARADEQLGASIDRRILSVFAARALGVVPDLDSVFPIKAHVALAALLQSNASPTAVVQAVDGLLDEIKSKSSPGEWSEQRAQAVADELFAARIYTAWAAHDAELKAQQRAAQRPVGNVTGRIGGGDWAQF